MTHNTDTDGQEWIVALKWKAVGPFPNKDTAFDWVHDNMPSHIDWSIRPLEPVP